MLVIGNFTSVFTKITKKPLNGPYAKPAINAGTSSKWNSKKVGKIGTENLSPGTKYKIIDIAANKPVLAMKEVSIILYLVPGLKFSVPIFPTFLEFHFDEVPALIAGFAYGPLSGFFVILVKTLVKLPTTNTMCVGEIADFIYSAAFVIPASLIYKKHRSIKGALVSLSIATLIQVIVSSFVTSFLILDFYIFMMGWPKVAIINMCKAANPHVTSLGFTFLLYIALPFNALKDAAVVLITFLLYKRLHVIIDKIGQQKN